MKSPRIKDGANDQVLPSNCENTGPRQYRCAGDGTGPSKSTRNATSSDSESSLICPGDIDSDRPLFAPRSEGSPHNGVERPGNTKHNINATGRPCSIMTALRRIALREGKVRDAACGSPVSTSSATPTSST